MPFVHLNIDGHWIKCESTGSYGYLGSRFVCRLNKGEQQGKQLLLRFVEWPCTQQTASEVPKLFGRRVSDSVKEMLRPAVGKNYTQAIPQSGGKSKGQERQVLQQDITGLVPLGEAVLGTLNGPEPRRIWGLFYAACQALEQLGNCYDETASVPLQCPTSLAVSTDQKVICLDAEIGVVGSVASHSEAQRVYSSWFGETGVKGHAPPNVAAKLHAQALLRYFLDLLGGQPGVQNGENSILQGLASDLQHLRSANYDLEQLEGWTRDNNEDWLLPLDLEDTDPPRREHRTRPKKRMSLTRLSAWLNLILVGLLLLLWFFGAGSGSETNKDATSGSHSPYCVVIPTQGTIPEKVRAQLDSLFPGKVLSVSGNPDARSQLLQSTLTEMINRMDNPEEVKQLLVNLSTKHKIRFRGFDREKPDEGLRQCIERGGIFTIQQSSREQHGSLLQPQGKSTLLQHAKLSTDVQADSLLDSLRQVIITYAGLQDALNLTRGRPAFLIKVEPTVEAHGKLRDVLLSRTEQPLFISRPIILHFDAVDPTTDTGGGFAEYALRLDTRCYWRIAGQEDRAGVDYENTANIDRMRWQEFPPAELISWKPISLSKTNGKIDTVESFDLAVVHGGEIIIFRNQRLLLGNSRDEVLQQGTAYLKRGLEIEVTPEDAISIREKGEQFSGAFRYSYLAGQVTERSAERSAELEKMSLTEFEHLQKRENAAVKP